MVLYCKGHRVFMKIYDFYKFLMLLFYFQWAVDTQEVIDKKYLGLEQAYFCVCTIEIYLSFR